MCPVFTPLLVLPRAVLWFTNLCSLSKLFELRDYGLSLLLTLESGKCSINVGISFSPEPCCRASVILAGHNH